jgi:hypothetical protein
MTANFTDFQHFFRALLGQFWTISIDFYLLKTIKKVPRLLAKVFISLHKDLK